MDKKIIGLIVILFCCFTSEVCMSQSLINSKFVIDNANDTEFSKKVSLELLSDSTFRFQCFYDYGGYTYSKGNWYISNNKLILNSDLTLIEHPLDIRIVKQKTIKKPLAITMCLDVKDNLTCNDKFYIQPYINDINTSQHNLFSNIVSYKKRPKIGLYNNTNYTFYIDSLIKSIRFETIRLNLYNVYNDFNKQIAHPVQSELKKITTEYGDSLIVKFDIDNDYFGYRVFKNKKIIITDENHLYYDDIEKNVFDDFFHSKVFLKKANVSDMLISK